MVSSFWLIPDSSKTIYLNLETALAVFPPNKIEMYLKEISNVWPILSRIIYYINKDDQKNF